jgi:hypothetical protein
MLIMMRMAPRLLHRAVGQRGAQGFAAGKKGTVEVAGAIDQQQGFLGFCHRTHFACAEFRCP